MRDFLKNLTSLSKILRIIKAHFRDKEKLKKEQWYVDRLNACSNCEWNSKNHMDEIMSNESEKKIYKLNRKKEYCFICKCGIENKASEKLEECSDKTNQKWKEINQ